MIIGNSKIQHQGTVLTEPHTPVRREHHSNTVQNMYTVHREHEPHNIQVQNQTFTVQREPYTHMSPQIQGAPQFLQPESYIHTETEPYNTRSQLQTNTVLREAGQHAVQTPQTQIFFNYK